MLSVGFIVAMIWYAVCTTFSIGSVEYMATAIEVYSVVMTGGVIGYLIKSAQENKVKIEKNPEFLKEEDEGEYL